MRSLILVTAFIQCFLYSQSQEASSLLWEISGNNLEKPSYLFGTIHLICPDDLIMGDEVKTAFTSADALFLELDMDDPLILTEMQAQLMLPEGKTLKEFLNIDDYILLDNYLKEKLGMGMDIFSRMKPMAIMSMSMRFMVTCKPQSYEEIFTQMATEQKKEVSGLETVKYQMNIFDSIPYDKQLNMIVEMIREGNKAVSEFEKMIELYKNQDINSLYLLMDTSSLNLREYDDILLDNRNKNWIPVLEANMISRSIFVAFGVAHLAGEKGVLELLRQRGYVVKPLRVISDL